MNTFRSASLTWLALSLVAPLGAQTRVLPSAEVERLRSDQPVRLQQAQDLLHARSEQLGLDGNHGFRLHRSHVDEFGITHACFHQTYRGVRVWEGEVITHLGAKGEVLEDTDRLHRGIALVTEPSLSQSEALAKVHAELRPRVGYEKAPVAELVVVPVTHLVFHPRSEEERRLGEKEAPALAFQSEVDRFALAYHVHAEPADAGDGPQSMDYFVDAHSGAVLKSWSTLETLDRRAGDAPKAQAQSATKASSDIIIIPFPPLWNAKSEYSGNVWANETYHTLVLPPPYSVTLHWYSLQDPYRGTGGTFGSNTTTNLDHATSGNGTVYTDTDGTWGDYNNYIPGGSTTDDNGETAAVDAHYGLMATWDFYKKVLGRNGIDGMGTSAFNRVHYGTNYNNAGWNGTCMTYGDGDGVKFKNLTAIDVAGHEMSHGVCQLTANLTYSGESGGLNESNSDIFGSMVEFYAKGSGGWGTTIPSTGGNFLMGEQIMVSLPFLRCMYKPSKDSIVGGPDVSLDAWNASLYLKDPHYASGPMNRCFYFLSQGASNVVGSDTYSSYLPAGMTGIGNDSAARIWYRTLTTYLTSGSTYANARAGALNAAKDLYGLGSTQYNAVANAFKAINVF